MSPDSEKTDGPIYKFQYNDLDVSRYKADYLRYIFFDGQFIMAYYNFSTNNRDVLEGMTNYLYDALAVKYGESNVDDAITRRDSLYDSIGSEYYQYTFNRSTRDDDKCWGWELSDGTLIILYAQDNSYYGHEVTLCYFNEPIILNLSTQHDVTGL